MIRAANKHKKVLFEFVNKKTDAVHSVKASANPNPVVAIQVIDEPGYNTDEKEYKRLQEFDIQVTSSRFRSADDQYKPIAYRVTQSARKRKYIVVDHIIKEQMVREAKADGLDHTIEGFIRFYGDIIDIDNGEVVVATSTNFIDPLDIISGEKNKKVWNDYLSKRGHLIAEKEKDKNCKPTLRDLEVHGGTLHQKDIGDILSQTVGSKCAEQEEEGEEEEKTDVKKPKRRAGIGVAPAMTKPLYYVYPGDLGDVSSEPYADPGVMNGIWIPADPMQFISLRNII